MAQGLFWLVLDSFCEEISLDFASLNLTCSLCTYLSRRLMGFLNFCCGCFDILSIICPASLVPAPEVAIVVSYCGSWLPAVVGAARFAIAHFMYLFSSVTASFSVFCLTFRWFPRDIRLLARSPQCALEPVYCFCCYC